MKEVHSWICSPLAKTREPERGGAGEHPPEVAKRLFPQRQEQFEQERTDRVTETGGAVRVKLATLITRLDVHLREVSRAGDLGVVRRLEVVRLFRIESTVAGGPRGDARNRISLQTGENERILRSRTEWMVPSGIRRAPWPLAVHHATSCSSVLPMVPAEPPLASGGAHRQKSCGIRTGLIFRSEVSVLRIRAHGDAVDVRGLAPVIVNEGYVRQHTTLFETGVSGVVSKEAHMDD